MRAAERPPLHGVVRLCPEIVFVEHPCHPVPAPPTNDRIPDCFRVADPRQRQWDSCGQRLPVGRDFDVI